MGVDFRPAFSAELHVALKSINIGRSAIYSLNHPKPESLTMISADMPNVAIADTAADKRTGLYPPIAPYMQGRLKVSEIHELYYEEAGNPRGIPVLTVHGGPGGGSSPTMRRYHDPKRYRIILFDQRGCGRSTPHAELEENTTWHLVDDIEKLRMHLGIERWHLFGGSWGSTLSLAYAQSYPERVNAMVLRGIFLMRRREVQWFYQQGCNWLYPDAYEAFAAQINPADRDDMITAYYAKLTHEDRGVRLAAARAWSMWEGTTLSIAENPGRVRMFGSDDFALAFARIECHYFVNRGFFERDDQLLAGVDRIRHIPTTIVNGRYDVITPVQNAWDLIKEWPEAQLRIVPLSGHAMTEPGTVHELISATEDFGKA